MANYTISIDQLIETIEQSEERLKEIESKILTSIYRGVYANLDALTKEYRKAKLSLSKQNSMVDEYFKKVIKEYDELYLK